MDKVLLVFVCALICVHPLTCGAKKDGAFVIKTIPKAECVNKIIDDEIRHYLAQQDTARQECYWNIRTGKDNGVFMFRMFRGADFVPAAGIAYLQYGNDIIIVEGKLDRALFRRVKGHDRSMKMSRIQRAHVDDSFGYLGLVLFNGRLSRKYCRYDSYR
ncbi:MULTISPECIES: hypothetical protein [Bacteroides]|jgi:hypothetical protein|uniref:hypothetical protein n=1 Tax=Bacteroides TaxID=816 RepID=UPI0025948F7B|nr:MULTISPECIES: hypothetical protein [Bacteroides]